MHKGYDGRSASFFVAEFYGGPYAGTFGWPFLVRGSSNPLRSATLHDWNLVVAVAFLFLHKETMSMYKRALKVRQAHRDYTLKNQEHKGNASIPALILKGTWLEKAGFTIDLPVFVIVRDKLLVIEPQDD